jgi:hypothetical protein
LGEGGHRAADRDMGSFLIGKMLIVFGNWILIFPRKICAVLPK